MAGERAHALNASREAYEWFRAAAEASADDPTTRGELLEAAANEIYLLGDTAEATRVQKEAIALHEGAGDDRRAAAARTWLGRYIWLMGDPIEAERQHDLAVGGLERHGPSPALAMAYSFRAQSLMLVPDFDAAEHWARQAIAVAEATGATNALVHAMNNLGTCLIGRSDARGVDYLLRSRALALEHHLPDEVGRANNNLTGQGARIFPLAYEDMDRIITEGIEYSRRTIPDGIFDRWIRVAYGEFLLVTSRWPEAERVLLAVPADPGQAYLRGEVLSMRALLLAYRGRYDEAASTTEGLDEAAIKVNDLQAVLPPLATQAVIRYGREDDEGALDMLRRAIERRGDIDEAIMSPWLLFESTDAVTARVGRDPTSAALREAVAVLAVFARHIEKDVMAGGDLVQVEVREALYRASVEQLRSLARRVGTSVDLSEPAGDGRAEAVGVLDREHRLFDAARIGLWLAEDGDAAGDLRAATLVFEELNAHPHLERATVAAARGG